MSEKKMKKHSSHSSNGAKPHKTIHYFLVPILYALILLVIAIPAEFAFKNAINDNLIDGYKNSDEHSFYDDVIIDRELPLSDNGIYDTSYKPIAKNEGYGKVFVENVGLNSEVYKGIDSKCNLRNGVGSSDSLPGGDKPVFLYGYSTKHFKKLSDVKVNDEVVFNTTYGKYTYVVDDIRVAEDLDDSSLDSNNLVMYCTNGSEIFDSTKPDKLYVISKLKSGPNAVEDIK